MTPGWPQGRVPNVSADTPLPGSAKEVPDATLCPSPTPPPIPLAGPLLAAVGPPGLSCSLGKCRGAFLDKAVAADGIGCASLMQSPAGLRSWPPSLVGSEPTGTGSSNSYLASQLSRIHFDLH
ncbi:MAG: hypothetical protein FRX49_06595 [Trebouxia sp. A1-2]|nr:MAG: hypothetical protein FRX49_06595 [Trebouxia sp. A1-2]